MKTRYLTAIALSVLLLQASLPLAARAQVPGIINYQGRVIAAGTNFDGTGQFEFALVNATGTTNYLDVGGATNRLTQYYRIRLVA